MCILFLKESAPIDLCSVIAFNRDERIERETKELHRWREGGGDWCLSGIDLERGGAWLTLDSRGLFSAVTNNRELPIVDHAPVSRGQAVLELLRLGSVPAFRKYLYETQASLSNSNFIYGDLEIGGLYCTVIHGGRSGKTMEIKDMAVISNVDPESNWEKLSHGRDIFANVLERGRAGTSELIRGLWRMLQDRTEYTRNRPQNTSLSSELEKRASSTFREPVEIQESALFATVSSTILLVGHANHGLALEQTWYPEHKLVYEKFTLNA